MDQGQRERIERDTESLVCVRDRVKKIRDTIISERRRSARRGCGCDEVANLLSEASHALLIVIDRLDKARQK